MSSIVDGRVLDDVVQPGGGDHSGVVGDPRDDVGDAPEVLLVRLAAVLAQLAHVAVGGAGVALRALDQVHPGGSLQQVTSESP